MRKRWLATLYRLASQNKNIVFVGSDLTNDAAMKQFREEMPKQFFMDGVSEQHLVGMSAGLAKTQKIVYFNTIATFITRRCYEQIVVDLALSNVKVRLIGNGGGVVYAPLGPTHLAIEDIAIMRAIPNMTVIVPTDADEMERAMVASVDYPGPIYFRVAKGGDPIVSDPNKDFVIGKAIPYRDSGQALIVTTGIMVNTALQASDKLAQLGIKAGVLHVPTVKPLDTEAVSRAIRDTQTVITLEEHSIVGGLGSAVAELIAESPNLRPRHFKRLGLPDYFPTMYGSQAQFFEKHKLTVPHVVECIQQSL